MCQSCQFVGQSCHFALSQCLLCEVCFSLCVTGAGFNPTRAPQKKLALLAKWGSADQLFPSGLKPSSNSPCGQLACPLRGQPALPVRNLPTLETDALRLPCALRRPEIFFPEPERGEGGPPQAGEPKVSRGGDCDRNERSE